MIFIGNHSLASVIENDKFKFVVTGDIWLKGHFAPFLANVEITVSDQTFIWEREDIPTVRRIFYTQGFFNLNGVIVANRPLV